VINVVCGVQARRKGGVFISFLGWLKVHYLGLFGVLCFLFIRRGLSPHLQPNGGQGNIKAYLRHFYFKSFILARVSSIGFILLQIS